RHECYLLAVPSNTAVRDLVAADPPYPGRGGRPRGPFTRGDRWCAAVAGGAWRTIGGRAGAGGPGGGEGGVGGGGGGARGPVGGGGGGGIRRAASGGQLEAGLPVVQCAAEHAGGGVRPRVQGPTPDRGVLAAGQRRGRPGGL